MNTHTTITGEESASPSDILHIMRGLDYCFLQVRRMMAFFDQKVPDEPTLQPLDRAEARSKWIRSECDELEEARTLEDQADAYNDILVFALGGLNEIGVLPQALFDFVIESQFGKVHIDEQGNECIVKDETGKVVKPANWEADHAPEPKMRKEIARQKAAGLLRQLGA